jgi:hypothetical protein
MQIDIENNNWGFFLKYEMDEKLLVFFILRKNLSKRNGEILFVRKDLTKSFLLVNHEYGRSSAHQEQQLHARSMTVCIPGATVCTRRATVCTWATAALHTVTYGVHTAASSVHAHPCPRVHSCFP